MVSLDGFRDTYFEECAELLEQLYAQLGAYGTPAATDDTIHAIFRAVHSIKGGGGAFGFTRLVAFAHVYETLLDLLRDGQVSTTAATGPLLLRAADILADLVAAARINEEMPPGFEDELCQTLRQAAEPGAPPRPVAAAAAAATCTADDEPERARYRIRFAPRPALYAHANDPLMLFRELARLGDLEVEADLSDLPDISVFQPDQAPLAWVLTLLSNANQGRIEEVFEFVCDDCALDIRREPDPSAAAAAQAEEEAWATLARPLEPEAPAAPPAPAERGNAEAGAPRPADTGAARSIRVDVEKLDKLVNLVGELVINQAMLAERGAALPQDLSSGLVAGLETLSQHLRELQDGVMSMRAQPVRSVFSRMPRLVREVSATLGREVRLLVSGEGTEIDKTVVEQLADPLTHLLRNALDHGIEPPGLREAQGKPRCGTVHLSAQHRSGRIVIEVEDDGAGIDRDKVLSRARERGLIPADAALTGEQIDDLIFLPGFSTAEKVSAISGRGVGMDVVRRNIAALGGRVTVESRFGHGSRFTMSLPLTLAILDGMAVCVGAETYIVLLAHIMESLRPRPPELHPVVGRGEVLAIRGEYVPLLHLSRLFDVPGAEQDPCRGIVVIVESEGGGRVGLVVDELLGQHQVVVKSLEANYGRVEGVSGATILGNGRVALILDIARLREMAGSQQPGLPAAMAGLAPPFPDLSSAGAASP